MKGKGKLQNKRGNSSENAKQFDKFQENHVKHGVSDKFSVILTLNGLGPKLWGKSYVKTNQNDFNEQFYPIWDFDFRIAVLIK